jgi:peptidoglycan/xylan/chitin deacetylase (PgdA/CDA1 family)
MCHEARRAVTGLRNHSFSHVDLARDGRPADGELAKTNALVGKITGYAPCLFRAPFGEVSPALIADAHSLGMMTIGWNVDPRDWARPGVRAIVRRVLAQTRRDAAVSRRALLSADSPTAA